MTIASTVGKVGDVAQTQAEHRYRRPRGRKPKLTGGRLIFAILALSVAALMT